VSVPHRSHRAPRWSIAGQKAGAVTVTAGYSPRSSSGGAVQFRSDVAKTCFLIEGARVFAGVQRHQSAATTPRFRDRGLHQLDARAGPASSRPRFWHFIASGWAVVTLSEALRKGQVRLDGTGGHSQFSALVRGEDVPDA